MEKILKVLKNKWFLFGISFLSFIYVFFVGNLVRITFCCYMEVNNFASLMALYLFINFIFGVLMFFTRKQIPTIICSIIIPLETFALMITAFGQWYIIIPPLAVGIVMFLLCGVGESCKTVLGTLFLLMYIVGGLVYSVFLNFGITLNYVIVNSIVTDQEIDINYDLRSSDYLMSPDGTYRLVKYVDESDNYTTTIYYVEEAYKDEHYPFLNCYRVFGCQRVLATVYDNDVAPEWLSDTVLYIDGSKRDMEELFSGKEAAEDVSDDESSDAEAAEDEADTEPAEDETAEDEADSGSAEGEDDSSV